MPRGRQDRRFALGTDRSEEERRFVVGVRQTDRNDHMSDSQVEGVREVLRDVKLFQRDLASFFDFGFDFAALLVMLDFHRRPGSSVLELDLGAQVPTSAEVVIEREHGARQRNLRPVVARGADGVRIAVRAVCHVLEQDFSVSSDAVFFEIPFERHGLAAESAFCLCADAGQTLIMLQQASMDDNK